MWEKTQPPAKEEVRVLSGPAAISVKCGPQFCPVPVVAPPGVKDAQPNKINKGVHDQINLRYTA